MKGDNINYEKGNEKMAKRNKSFYIGEDVIKLIHEQTMTMKLKKGSHTTNDTLKEALVLLKRQNKDL